MSLIEKAAKKLKKPDTPKQTRSAKKPNQQLNIDEDKTEVLDPHDLSYSDVDIDLDEIDKTQILNSIDGNEIIEEDITEEDITDISGFTGYEIKAKKSSFSNNLHIDLNKLNDDGFLSPKHPDTELSSTYRMIKRPLLNNAKGKGASIVEYPNLIQVTSSFANEGKTYTAINIAISMAMEQDLNVLLIDADIRKPSIAKTFNIDVTIGLTDYLDGDIKDMRKILHNTNIPSLTLMCAGKQHPNGTELLSSQAMNAFIKEVATRYPDRIIIFDSPPLLQTTESSTLASHMGQVVLVVEAESTLAPQVKKSIEILQNEIVLLLLNKQREKKNDIGYGYGY